MSAAPQSAVTVPSVLERSAHALLLALAMTVLLLPATSASWLAAGLGLLLVAWPLSLAERALAVRARKPWLSGMQLLTREADAARGWRLLSWSSLAASLLAMALLALLAGALATQALQTLAAGQVVLPAGTQLWPILTVLVLLTGLLRPLGKAPVLVWLLPAALLLAAEVLQLVQGREALVLTSDLALAAALPAQTGLLAGALALGGGLGVLWQQASLDGQRLAPRGLASVLVLAALLLAGLHAAHGGLFAVLLGLVAALLAITALAQPVLAVLRERGLKDWMALTLIFVPVVLLTEAIWFFGGITALAAVAEVLALWMSFNLLVLAIYAGWVMKISHVRKALQLPSEGLYNLWRVSVRWVAPVTLLIALVQLLRAVAA